MKSDLILVGGGGHCRSCIEVIESIPKMSISGVVDLPEMVGRTVLGYPIVGADTDLARLTREYAQFFVTVGHIENAELRMKLSGVLDGLGASQPVLIASTARVSRHAALGAGTIVHHHAIVNAGATVGQGCIINTGALVEHDAVVGDFCHISTRAVLNGGVTVGRGSFVGSGAVVLQGICVGRAVLIGAGTVVLRNVEDNERCVGNPGRQIGGV